MRPKITHTARNNTHRLIPTRYSEDADGVLARLGLPQSQTGNLLELEGATNDRVAGEANLLPGITVHELVFGVPHYHIINAAFTYARPGGTRFSSARRGAWYAGFSLKTAQTEVAYHYAQGLREIDWREEETVSYREYLADFRAEFHDLRKDGLRTNDRRTSDRRRESGREEDLRDSDLGKSNLRTGDLQKDEARNVDPRGNPAFADCLDPNSYRASQRLAADLLHRGSAGIVYPSVRHKGGTCIACFRPALVSNVRQGKKIIFTFADPFRPPRIRLGR